MHAGLAGAVVRPGQAQRAVGVGRAQTVEAVDLVHAGSSAHARVGAALVDLHITLGPCSEQSRLEAEGAPDAERCATALPVYPGEQTQR